MVAEIEQKGTEETENGLSVTSVSFVASIQIDTGKDQP
jgi:hypothetical protein